jgi:hypothetical protein
MRNSLIRLILAAALAVPACSIASAQNEPSGAAKSHWLGKTEVEAKVAAAGYTVKRIRNGIGRYEVRVIRKDGKTIWLYVNPWTGEIAEQEAKK